MSLLTMARTTRHTEIEVSDNTKNQAESRSTFRIAYPETTAHTTFPRKHAAHPRISIH